MARINILWWQMRRCNKLIPFVKSHEFNYSKLLPAAVRGFSLILHICRSWSLLSQQYLTEPILLMVWMDGKQESVRLLGFCSAFLLHASGNLRFAEYLNNIMYIPNLGELSIFIEPRIGACRISVVQCFPAQVFMGDTGSLTLGGIIASLAIIVRKELLIPIFCGVCFW